MQERKTEADRLQMVRTLRDNQERLAARQLAQERDKMEADRWLKNPSRHMMFNRFGMRTTSA